ncbi:glycosyltransferase [Lactobacillus kunkeei]|nr:glycosyltransferase [Apilactobacillus kunkeei]
MNEPYLSVIVACYNVQDYIEKCLSSIANTNFPMESLEVLMIDDGSTDNTSKIIDEFANKYDSFRALHKENGGVSNTRNYGMKHARGKYIAFVDGDDIVPANAYPSMAFKARQNDSDLVVGFVKRFDKNRYENSYLHSFAVKDDYDKTHITTNHDLMYDTTSWNKLYKRSFLLDNSIKFIEGIIYEDIPFTMEVHLKSRKTSVIEDNVYEWRWRESSDSITQTRSALSNFESRLSALRRTLQIIKDNGFNEDDSFVQDFKYKALFLDLFIFTESLGDNSSDYIYQAQEMVYKFLRDWNLWDSEIFNHLPVKQQILYSAIRCNDVDMINDISYRKQIGEFRHSIGGSNYRLVSPELHDKNGLVANANLNDNNSRFIQKIKDVEVTNVDNGDLNIQGAFKINKLHLVKQTFGSGNKNELIQASLINVKNKKTTKVQIKRIESPFIRRTLKPNAKFNNADYEIKFNMKKAIDTLGVGTWKVQVKDTVDNHIMVKDFISEPIEKLTQKSILPFEYNGVKIITRFNSVDSLVFEVIDLNSDNDRRPVVSYPTVSDDKQILTFDVNNMDVSGYNAVLMSGNGEKIHSIDQSKNSFSFNIQDLNTKARNHELKLIILDNFTLAEMNYSFSSNKINQQINLKNGDALSMFYGDTNNMQLVLEEAPFVAQKVTVDANNILHVSSKLNKSIDVNGVLMSQTHVELISADKATRKVLNPKDNHFQINGDVFTFDFNLTSDDMDQLDLLEGDYQFKVYLQVDGKAHTYRIKYSKKCKIKTTELPFNGKSKIFYSVKKDKGMNLIFKVVQPFFGVIDSKKGLRSISYSVLYPLMRLLPLRNVMVFDAYWSSKFDSNEKLMYEYVEQNHPEIKPVWIFNNIETKITGDGEKVRVNTFKYWYYLAVARYIIQNTNMPNRYAKRKGQIEVETLHGTFLKHMGFDEPHFRFAPNKVQNRFAKRNRRWDYLVVPSDYMEKTAKHAFNYGQKVIKSGFPRNDELYANNNTDYINSIKNKLGIPLNKRVILYAPTYRADAGFEFKLDLDKMQEKLADGYVLLVRLHYFVAHSNSFYSNPGFVYDVSDYENINDLYLISDAMITDYSSVMFDYAHLKRPMIFYAYDADWYLDEENRGVYLDYYKQMPGPIVKTEDELIDRIRHLDSVEDNYSDQMEVFCNEFAQYGRSGDATQQVVETVLATQQDELDQEPAKSLLFQKMGHFWDTNFFQAKLLNELSKRLSKKDIVIFDSFFGTQYSDNPKAIYEYMKANYPEFKLYWNVNKDDREFFELNQIPYVNRFGFKGLLKQARAKYWVTNSRRPFRWHPSKDTVVLQTWHGTPLKTIGADVMKVTMPGVDVAKYHKQVFKDNRRWTRLIAPNMYSAEIMQRCFRMQASQIQLDGYPRNDILVNHTVEDVNEIKEDLGIDDSVKVILYAPTWRDNEYIKNDRFTAKLHLDLQKLRDRYEGKAVVLVRTHYLISNSLDLSDYEGFALDVSDYPDIAELYLVSDVLITDYSSVMFDYATLKRPMIFFTYDLEDYANAIRGFYFDFIKEAPGPIVRTNDEVIQSLDDIFGNDWKPDDKYEYFYKKYSAWMDGKSSKRSVEKMLSDHSLETFYSDDLLSQGLSEQMVAKDSATLWAKEKDFANYRDNHFVKYLDGDKEVKVIKTAQLCDREFKEFLGSKYALVSLDNHNYWINTEELSK